MRHRTILTLGLAALFILFCPPPAQSQQADNQETASFEKRITGYVDAFNKADSKALANYWNEQGEFVASSGERWQGRTAIAEGFSNWFAEVKEARLELLDPHVEVQSPSVAVETGIARLTIKDQEPEETEYRAVLVKTADGWKIDSVGESEVVTPPPSNADKLQELAWMVGHWSTESDGSSVESTCRWSTNNNFLVQSFRVVVNESVDFEGTQVIGWDPQAETIRSWLFDSDGGFGAGRWSGGDGRWTVQTLNVTPDGRNASATNIYELIDENNLRYSSIGRQVESELVANVEPIVVSRISETKPIE